MKRKSISVIVCSKLETSDERILDLAWTKYKSGYDWAYGGDGSANIDSDPLPDICCSAVPANTLYRLCYPAPVFWARGVFDPGIGQWTGVSDPNYHRIDIGDTGFDPSSVGKGDIFWLVDRTNPTNNRNSHSGIVAAPPRKTQAADGSWGWEVPIFHSLEDGVGPTRSVVCVYPNGTAQVRLNDGTYSHYLHGGFYRPKLRCLPCKRDSDSLPPKPTFSGGGPAHDPLVLDLDGTGIHTLPSGTGIHFDHDGDGFLEASAWITPGNGLLMLDRNGNGRLDRGTELFGDFTLSPDGTRAANAFQSLALFDSNGDMKIDSLDLIWTELRVWQHQESIGGLIQDPRTDGKLCSLDELGISAICLDSLITNTLDEAGNTELRSGLFQWQDGRTGTISEYSLLSGRSDTLAEEILEVPPDVASLPDLYGYGDVYDLHQAAVRDSSGQLKTLVEAFVLETIRANREQILQDIIFKWTGGDTVASDARGPFMDGRKVVALERLYGDPPQNPDRSLAVAWEDLYREISEFFYADLMAQTHLKPLFDLVGYLPCDDTQEPQEDFSAVITALQTALEHNPEQGRILLSEFARTIRGLAGGDRVECLPCRELFLEQDPSLGWVIDTGGLPVIEGTPGGQSTHIVGTLNAEAIRDPLGENAGEIHGWTGDDVIYGSDNAEGITQEGGDALIVAGRGNDTIWAGPGNNIIDGGPGNDMLYGEAGNDTYLFRRGSGQDRIIDIDATAGNVDTIWLGSNLTPVSGRCREAIR